MRLIFLAHGETAEPWTSQRATNRESQNCLGSPACFSESSDQMKWHFLDMTSCGNASQDGEMVLWNLTWWLVVWDLVKLVLEEGTSIWWPLVYVAHAFGPKTKRLFLWQLPLCYYLKCVTDDCVCAKSWFDVQASLPPRPVLPPPPGRFHWPEGEWLAMVTLPESHPRMLGNQSTWH